MIVMVKSHLKKNSVEDISLYSAGEKSWVIIPIDYRILLRDLDHIQSIEFTQLTPNWQELQLHLMWARPGKAW